MNGSRDAPDCPSHGKRVQTGGHSGRSSIPGDTGRRGSRAWLGGWAARGSLERPLLLAAKKACAESVFQVFSHLKLFVHPINHYSLFSFFFFFLRPWGKLTGFTIFSSSIGLTLLFWALTKQHSSHIKM